MPLLPRRILVLVLLPWLTLAGACSDPSGITLATTNPNDTSPSVGVGGSGAGGTNGKGGGGGQTGGAGRSGSTGVGGSPVVEEGADFAAIFDDPSECSLCLRAKCKAENAACGDIAVAGSGACSQAALCLADAYESNPEVLTYDCFFATCLAENPLAPVNDMFVCTAKRCSNECFVSEGFVACEGG